MSVRLKRVQEQSSAVKARSARVARDKPLYRRVSAVPSVRSVRLPREPSVRVRARGVLLSSGMAKTPAHDKPDLRGPRIVKLDVVRAGEGAEGLPASTKGLRLRTCMY